MTATATLAAGCFWGVELAYRRKFGGIIASSIKVGFSGGTTVNPSYKDVCTGRTGHAEVITFQYDPAVTSYATILDFFFRMHDPTTLNSQGNDRGTQYRSAIFVHNDEQRAVAEQAIARAKIAYRTIATTVEPFKAVYDAEDYHQDYLNKNPNGYHCATHFERQWSKIAAEYGGSVPDA